MTEIEYQEFVRHCPYDAMGDYSMFRKKTDIRYSAMIESCLVCVDVTERSWKLRKRKNADRILQLR